MPCVRWANFRAYDYVIYVRVCVRVFTRKSIFSFCAIIVSRFDAFVSLYCSHARGCVHGSLQKSAQMRFMHAPQASKLVRAARVEGARGRGAFTFHVLIPAGCPPPLRYFSPCSRRKNADSSSHLAAACAQL